MPRLDLGATPCEESCAQVGSHDYSSRARKECAAYARQLMRQHGEPPDGSRFVITSNPHDFGTYHEVAVTYDPDKPASMEYAFKVENDTPANWDDQARRELLLAESKPFTVGAALYHKMGGPPL